MRKNNNKEAKINFYQPIEPLTMAEESPLNHLKSKIHEIDCQNVFSGRRKMFLSIPDLIDPFDSVE